MREIKVILDTNFLLTMVRHRIHGFEEIRAKIPAKFYVLSRIMWELEQKSKENKKLNKEVRLVKQILEKNEVKGLESTKNNVDTELVELSKEYVIATNDKELRERIKRFGGKSIYIRSLSFIETEDLFD